MCFLVLVINVTSWGARVHLLSLWSVLFRCYHVIICICAANFLDSDEDTSEKSTDEDHLRSTVEELTDLHFKFEVREGIKSKWSHKKIENQQWKWLHG